jgi:hypothetical protein
MRRGAWLLLCLIAPLTAPLLSSCALNPPRIVSISPSREVTDVPTNSPITITFDRPMNRQSVASRFELQPSLAGCAGSSACRVAWSGDTFEFLHAGVNFAISTQYTVSMLAGYADETGQQNTLDHVWRFTTERAPTLSSVDPGDSSANVPPDRNIVLSFNRPMQAASVLANVGLTPDTAFLLRARPGGDGSQYEIVPTTVLLPNQTYTLTVDRPLDVHGNALPAPLQTQFRTGSLALLRKIGYLVARGTSPAFGIGIVDPHPDPFLQASTPKLIYALGAQGQQTDALRSFDWAPDGLRLAVVDAPRNASSGPIEIVDVATGIAVRPGIAGSQVYWSADGTIVYLNAGVLHRFDPTTLTDLALTDASDGVVVGTVALSPDGKSVAYSTMDAQGLDRLWVMNLDLRTRYRLPNLTDPADTPSWSPSGSKLAFRRLTVTGAELWIYDLGGNGASAFRRIAPLDVTATAWLPDNSTLIAATGAGETASLYRINIFSVGEAGGVQKVTGVKEASNGSAPNIAAYDRRIAFVGEVNGLPQIFVMNGDGSRPQQLTGWQTDYPFSGSAPNWTPTG